MASIILGAALLSLIPPGDEAIATLVGEEPNAGCSGVRTLHINGVKWASPEDTNRGTDMKRRTFLRMIGLAPVAAALPAMAMPRPDKPTDIDSLKIDVSGPDTEAWFLDASKAGPSRIVINIDALDGDLAELHHWLDVSTKKTIADLKALGHL